MLVAILGIGAACQTDPVGPTPLSTIWWIQVPEDLSQRNIDGSPLPKLEVAKANEIYVTGFTNSQSLNACSWQYRLEVELRNAREAFQGQPTHEGAWIPRSSTEQRLGYPVVTLSNLAPQSGYKWAAREKVQAYTAHHGASGLERCEPSQVRVSEWEFHNLPLQFSFRTPAPPVLVVPDSVSVEIGAIQSGSAADLRSNDGVRLTVSSVVSESLLPGRFPTNVLRRTARSAWIARFLGLPSTAKHLTAAYDGMSLQGFCLQEISAWNVMTNRWDYHSADNVGPASDTLVQFRLTGSAADYLTSTGELRLRVECRTTNFAWPFSMAADMFQLGYTQ